MDATYVLASCSFVMAELIRVFHGCSTLEAQSTVDALVERKVPLVWEFGGGKRVLSPKMLASDKVLLLLYSEPSWVQIADLFDWARYSNKSQFDTRVLAPLDKKALIELDLRRRRCLITPLGIQRVESELLEAVSVT